MDIMRDIIEYIHIVSLTAKGLCPPMWTKLRHSVTEEWGDPAMRSQSTTQGLRLVNLAMHICISFKITKTSLGYTLSIRGPNSKNPTVQLKYWQDILTLVAGSPKPL